MECLNASRGDKMYRSIPLSKSQAFAPGNTGPDRAKPLKLNPVCQMQVSFSALLQDNFFFSYFFHFKEDRVSVGIRRKPFPLICCYLYLSN